MLELSRLTASNLPDVCEFSLRERIDSLTSTFASPGKSGVSNSVVGDLNVSADRNQVTSLIFNLTSNALRAFQNRKTSAPTLVWTLTPSPPSMTCFDNAGGFSEQALQALSHGHIYSGFAEGSGMGFQIMRDCVAKLGGRLEFGNRGGGAWVTWHIPRERVIA